MEITIYFEGGVGVEEFGEIIVDGLTYEITDLLLEQDLHLESIEYDENGDIKVEIQEL